MWDGSKVTIADGYEDIHKWGKILADLINGYEFEDGEELNIVAHSHGGNVVKVALNQGLNRVVNNLVTLGTPQNYDLVLSRQSEVRNHCNVYSTADPAQFFGASLYQVRQTFLHAQKSDDYGIQAAWADLYGLHDLARTYRELSVFHGLASKNWEMSTRVDFRATRNVSVNFVSHSGLHTPEMLNSIKGSCGL